MSSANNNASNNPTTNSSVQATETETTQDPETTTSCAKTDTSVNDNTDVASDAAATCFSTNSQPLEQQQQQQEEEDEPDRKQQEDAAPVLVTATTMTPAGEGSCETKTPSSDTENQEEATTTTTASTFSPSPPPSDPLAPALAEAPEGNSDAQVVAEQTPDDNDSKEDEDEDDDAYDVSQAAVTYAALAAAAMANHKSPAEAARSARLAAQTLLQQQVESSLNSNSNSDYPFYNNSSDFHSATNTAGDGGSGGNGNNKTMMVRELRLLPMTKVLAFLEKQQQQPLKQQQQHQQLLVENLGFLSHLFLLDYYLLHDDVNTDAVTAGGSGAYRGGGSGGGSGNIMGDSYNIPLLSSDEEIQQACAGVLHMFKRIDGAYESLLSMLPHVVTPSSSSTTSPNNNKNKNNKATNSTTTTTTASTNTTILYMEEEDQEEEEDEFDDYETPVVVPDLLPPCTSPRGDATLAFFRACIGLSTTSTMEQQQQATSLSSSSSHHQHADSVSSSTTAVGTSSSSLAASSSETSTFAAKAATTNSTPPSSPTRQTTATAAHTFLGMFKRPHHHSGSTATSGGASSSTITAGAGAGATSSASSSGLASSMVGSSLGSVFRKKSSSLLQRNKNVASATSSTSTANTTSSTSFTASGVEDGSDSSNNNNNDAYFPMTPGCYSVKIEREMLGLTVENVLERTVVRTVLPGGPAKKAGAQVGSLITQVGNTPTRNLTHFETIDELRQSQRPLLLVLKHVGEDALRLAREEMGRLIRGAGFGLEEERPLRDVRLDSYTNLMRRRWLGGAGGVGVGNEGAGSTSNDKLGEKLVWILTLFVLGLEREAERLHQQAALLHRADSSGGINSASSSSSSAQQPLSPRRRHSVYSHTAQDYSDAAKSVGKVLWDYSRKRLLSSRPLPPPLHHHHHKSLPPPPPPLPPPPPSSSRRGIIHASAGGASSSSTSTGSSSPSSSSNSSMTMIHDTTKPLLQIGDVLQRTRTFLADTTSPPAALLRGELISFLCDVLDADTDMELAEDESVSSSIGGGGSGGFGGGGSGHPGMVVGGGGAGGGGAGNGAAMINDLGSAGSLLKLIVLNAPIMRSPGCCDSNNDTIDVEELRRRFGPREEGFTGADVHKLHAGNRFLSVVHRLAASRSTSARITACSLGPVLWGHLDFPHQLQLRGVITRALHDVEVIVRKSTATVLHEIAELVFDRRCVPWLVLMCERAMTDPEPQLRSAAMTLTWHLAEHLPNAFLGNASQGSRYLRRLPNRDDPIFADVYLLQCKLLPVATRLAEDRSPSVRLAVAAQCDRLCDALGDHWSSVIIDVLLALLSDSDDRVRCEAVTCVPRLAEIVLLSGVRPGETAVSEVSILEALMPASIKLQSDSSSSVRIALAAAAGELLGLLVAMQAREADLAAGAGAGDASLHHHAGEPAEEGSKKYKRQVDDRLIPLLQTLLNDKDPEVTSAALRAVSNATRRSVHQQHSRHRKMSTASASELFDDNASFSSFHSHASDTKNAPVLTPVLSETQVLRLLPTLTELANSKQWRVRQSAVEIVPALLSCTHRMETRKEISKLCIRLMHDEVDAVRKTAAECLCIGSLGSSSTSVSSQQQQSNEDASAEWIASVVLPTMRLCARDSDSKQRLLSLRMVQTILMNGACPSKWSSNTRAGAAAVAATAEEADDESMADTPIRELVSIALSLTMDRIANVRLNVGRTLEPVLHFFEEEEVSFIMEVLLQQIENERCRALGPDADVLYFANKCVQRAKAFEQDGRPGDSETRLSC